MKVGKHLEHSSYGDFEVELKVASRLREWVGLGFDSRLRGYLLWTKLYCGAFLEEVFDAKAVWASRTCVERSGWRVEQLWPVTRRNVDTWTNAEHVIAIALLEPAMLKDPAESLTSGFSVFSIAFRYFSES
jgi:hypothetical protein